MENVFTTNTDFFPSLFITKKTPRKSNMRNLGIYTRLYMMMKWQLSSVYFTKSKIQSLYLYVQILQEKAKLEIKMLLNLSYL